MGNQSGAQQQYGLAGYGSGYNPSYGMDYYGGAYSPGYVTGVDGRRFLGGGGFPMGGGGFPIGGGGFPMGGGLPLGIGGGLAPRVRVIFTPTAAPQMPMMPMMPCCGGFSGGLGGGLPMIYHSYSS